MAQQTAVEWLEDHWKKLQSKGEKMSWQQIIDITELAKQMEREQPMAQQTAVEWLFEQYKKDGFLCSQDEEQAKEKEREQIVKAHGLKYFDLTEEVITGEQYYNETYGK